MEGPAQTIRRLASRSGFSSKQPAGVDAQGVPVHGTSTMNVDAQTTFQDAQTKTSAHTGIMSAVATAGHAASALVQAVKSGGETSLASATDPIFTSAHGIPMGDNTHSYNINGYIAASDVFLFEQQQLFNRAKIVERAVHACGSGAFGFLQMTGDVSSLTKAKLFQPNMQTPCFARFSTVTYGREFPDSARNPRGLALKFYTEDGNYDVLMVNFPVFFNRDPALGPSVVRSQQRNPQNFQVNLDSTLDFMSLVPESALANTWFWSDHGTPMGWRFFDAFPCHTFKWVNAQGQATWVRYAFVSEQGIKNFDFDSAVKMCGEDPDFAKRDLWQHIDRGGKAAWKFCIQTMTDQQASAVNFDPFDVTKVWPRENFPLREIGRLVIDRNPENYHRDVEQAAFSPGRMVPGVEPSPDPLLQFRCTFYNDAQLYRLGPNYHQIPVNCPFMAKQYHPTARDGVTRVDANGGVEANYYPNSFTVPRATRPDKTQDWAPVALNGQLERGKPGARSTEGKQQEYEQATQFYLRELDATNKQHLHYNVARAFANVSRWEVKLRFLHQAYRIHPDYAAGILQEVDKLGKSDPNVTWERLLRNIKELPHTVDQAAGYIPLPLV